MQVIYLEVEEVRMKTVYKFMILIIISLMAGAGGALAQAQDEVVVPLPNAYRMNSVGDEPQLWNNCGPATVTNALVHFGYSNDQNRAANWLKPDREDKNVSPWQLAEFVNTQVPEIPVYAITRSGGNAELIKTLLFNNFPVIIEKGYLPEGYDWMGHYLLMTGFDDSVNVFSTMDSFLGNKNYDYDYINEMWQHFNYTYVVLYTVDQEVKLMELLGDNADEWQNHMLSLEVARAEATLDQNDAYAWFNMGTNFVNLGMYDVAAQAYDKAIGLGLPWRMMWYQFGPYEAYYNTGRYDDMVNMARQNQNDGGGHYVEETWYYLGLAREGRGENNLALQNYNSAITFNPNFAPALEAKARVLALAG
jgi:hypothetical protein